MLMNLLTIIFAHIVTATASGGNLSASFVMADGAANSRVSYDRLEDIVKILPSGFSRSTPLFIKSVVGPASECVQKTTEEIFTANSIRYLTTNTINTVFEFDKIKDTLGCSNPTSSDFCELLGAHGVRYILEISVNHIPDLCLPASSPPPTKSRSQPIDVSWYPPPQTQVYNNRRDTALPYNSGCPGGMSERQCEEYHSMDRDMTQRLSPSISKNNVVASDVNGRLWGGITALASVVSVGMYVHDRNEISSATQHEARELNIRGNVFLCTSIVSAGLSALFFYMY